MIRRLDRDDPRRPAQGIVVGLLIALPLDGLVAAVVALLA